MVRQLTNGKWEIRALYGVDQKNGWVYFSATKDSYIAENVYRVKLTGGEPERLTTGNGWHAATFNKTFTHFVDNWSDATTPTQTRLYSADGRETRVISENKVAALSQYKLGQPEFLNVTTRDGFVMEALMIKPPDFDASKKYPVFSYTYSGPHAPQVRDVFYSFTTPTTLFPQALRDSDVPDLGYHYFSLDYLWTALEVTNASLTLSNGVAIGFYNEAENIVQPKGI